MELHVYYDGGDFVIAHDVDDAVLAWEENAGEGARHESRTDPECVFEQQPDDQEFSAALVEGEEPRTQTMQQWAKEQGRGWFCTENW